MLKIRYTEFADQDLFAIYIYTHKTWGAAQAQKYTTQLKTAIERLAQEPSRIGTVDRSALYPGSRSYLAKSHLVFYRVVDEHLEILRILHSRMDIPSYFKQPEDDL